MTLETQLRDALVARADELGGPASDPYVRVAGAVVTHRRRRRAATVGAVAAVAAVAVLVPALGQGDRGSTLPAKRTQVVVPGPNDPRWSAMSSWPVRGSLATDKGFLEGVSERALTQHVIFAGDLDRTRVVVGWDPEDGGLTRVSMFAGPRGGEVDELAGVSEWSGGNTDVVVLRESDDVDSRVVALTTPGRVLTLSSGVQIATDGRVSRDPFRRVDLTDGVYSEELQDSPPQFMRVRVQGGDSGDEPARLVGQPRQQAESLGSICLSCTGDDFRTKAEQAIGSGDAHTFGLRPQDVRSVTRVYGAVDPQVVERSDLGAKGPTTNQVIVVDTTLPAGQVLRSAVVVVSAKDGTAAMTTESATGVPIDAATAADRPFVIDRRLDDGRVTHQVFAPTAARVQLVSAATLAYPSTAKVPVRDGAAILTTPLTDPSIGAYEVVTYDSTGGEIGRWPVELPGDNWADATP